MNRSAGREPTHGYKESAGLWSVSLQRLDVITIEVLKGLADGASRAFLGAFADVSTLRSAEGVMTEIGDDGRIQRVHGEVALERLAGNTFRPVTDEESGHPASHTALTSLTLRCDVRVQHQGSDAEILQNGLYFHYDSGVQTVIGQLVKLDSPFVTVAVEVDPWLDAPLHGGRFLDNRIIAALNRPHLERALRRWEADLGVPISEASSVPYPALIDRYGFRPGGEPDAP
jgi:hypothetical protein